MYLHVLYRAKFEVNIIIKKWISCFYIHPIINLLTDMNKAKMGKWNADSKFTSYSGTIYMIEVIGSIPMFTSLHKKHTYSWYGWIVFWDWLFESHHRHLFHTWVIPLYLEATREAHVWNKCLWVLPTCICFERQCWLLIHIYLPAACANPCNTSVLFRITPHATCNENVKC